MPADFARMVLINELSVIHLTIVLQVKQQQDIAEIKTCLLRQGELSRAEPGCVRFDVFQSKNDESTFVLQECWESQGALDLHRLAEAYTTVYQPLVLPRVNRTPYPCELIS